MLTQIEHKMQKAVIMSKKEKYTELFSTPLAPCLLITLFSDGYLFTFSPLTKVALTSAQHQN